MVFMAGSAAFLFRTQMCGGNVCGFIKKKNPASGFQLDLNTSDRFVFV